MKRNLFAGKTPPIMNANNAQAQMKAGKSVDDATAGQGAGPVQGLHRRAPQSETRRSGHLRRTQ
jgi:hypothetical protein